VVSEALAAAQEARAGSPLAVDSAPRVYSVRVAHSVT
jgi:hypothetical protein